MNVLFINQCSFDFRGGVEAHILSLARELAKAGVRSTLVCDSGGTPPESRVVEGIRMERVAGLRGLRQFMRQHGPEFDLCHAHMARKPFSAYGAWLARRMGKPTLFTPHCFYPQTSLGQRVSKWAYDRTLTRITFWSADRVINLTPRDQQDAFERGLKTQRSRVIPNAIDVARLLNAPATDFRARYRIAREYLLHVGRFQQQKCIDFLVARQPLLEGYDLVLIGQDDGEARAIRALVEKLGLEGHVHLFHGLGLEHVCGAYRQAAALVMASRNEGLPTVVLEAMAFGVPVVAPAVGGIPYIITDGETGFLYPWGDRDLYVCAVGRALVDGARAALRAQSNLAQRFSWEVNARRILEEYRQLLGGAEEERSIPAFPVCDSKLALQEAERR